MDTEPTHWPFNDLGGFCLTLTRDKTPEQILRTYGADPSDAIPLTQDQAWRQYHRLVGVDGALLRVGWAGTWGFCFEQGATDGIGPPVPSELSLKTETIVVFSAPEAAMTLVRIFRDGHTAASTEMGINGPVSGPEGPSLAEELNQALALSSTDYVRAAVHVVGQRIGHDIRRQSLAAELLTAFLPHSRRRKDPAPWSPSPAHDGRLVRITAVMKPRDLPPR